MSQYVPTVEGSVSRLRTGYERVMAHRTSEPFASAAEQDGIVKDVNEELNLVKIEYKDGSIVTFQYGEIFTKNGGGGFYASQNIKNNNFKTGDKVKRGDIVTYNSEFFQADIYSKQVDWKMGYLINVALVEGDETIEDSMTITSEVADKIGFHPTHVKTVVLTKDVNIHQIVQVGSKISSIDPVLIFDKGDMPDTLSTSIDEDTVKLLGELNRETPKAKHSGTVVKIEALYNSPISDMSKSLAAIVKKCIKDSNAKAAYAADSKNKDEYQPSKVITDTDRIGIINLDPGTVILKFYIKEFNRADIGNKVAVASSLKGTIPKVIDKPIDTEDGSIKIDGLASYYGINNRIVCSPSLQGISSRILEKMEQDILNIYDE